MLLVRGKITFQRLVIENIKKVFSIFKDTAWFSILNRKYANALNFNGCTFTLDLHVTWHYYIPFTATFN